MRKDKYHPPFEADTFYHLYNHGVGNELLFRSEENYRYFLQKYGHYIPQIADTFAYCLMPNHFHFLIRIKKEEELRAFFGGEGDRGSAGFGNPPNLKKTPHLEKPLHQLLGQYFGNFFNAYAKAYNKMYHRKGSLFVDDVSRLVVGDERYFCNTLRYIHLNPIRHGFVDNLTDWKHTSYSSYHSNRHTQLYKEFTLNVFGSIKGFNEAHTFEGLDMEGIPFD